MNSETIAADHMASLVYHNRPINGVVQLHVNIVLLHHSLTG